MRSMKRGKMLDANETVDKGVNQAIIAVAFYDPKIPASISQRQDSARKQAIRRLAGSRQSSDLKVV